jgi:hypothetical protein
MENVRLSGAAHILLSNHPPTVNDMIILCHFDDWNKENSPPETRKISPPDKSGFEMTKR